MNEKDYGWLLPFIFMLITIVMVFLFLKIFLFLLPNGFEWNI
jgi:hypothetical protein